MHTSRRLATTLAALAAILVVPAIAFAADEPHPKAVRPPINDKISGVYDADGNPIDLDANKAGPKATPAAAAVQQMPTVQRGRDWWPYGQQLPPYNDVNAAVESLRENQIQVNGIVTLDLSDAAASTRAIPRDLLIASGAQAKEREGYYLVKIAGFSRTQKEVDALTAAGAVLGEYLNVNTYIAKIPGGSVEAVRSLPFVTFVGDYQPAYKISPRIGMEDIPVDQTVDQATGAAKPWILEVVLHKGASLADVVTGLESVGISGSAQQVILNDDFTLINVRTIPEAITFLAKIPGVKWIAEKPYAHLLASATSPATMPTLLQNNGVFTTTTSLGWKLWNAGIDGTATSQIITMMDSGLNTNMEHFANDTSAPGTLGAAHRKVIGYDNFGGDICVLNYTTSDGGHGTWTSQHAAGSISNMTTNPDTLHTPTVNYDDGIARGAKIYFQDIGTSTGSLATPADLTNSITTAEGKGSFIQNYSWGTTSPTYDAQTTTLDSALFANPNFLVTVAAGNGGATGQSTIGSPSTSKNCVTVGGVNAASPNGLFIDCNWDGTSTCASTDLGSARGPVSTSLRVKPDICTYVAFSAAVGGETEAGDRPHAMCQTDATKTVYWDWTNTNNFGGTSFAAPEAAGLAALIRDYFMQGFYPTGTATPANALTPSGSLMKAVLLASGEDLNTTASPQSSITIQKRYSNDVGYGRANVPGVLHIGSGAPFLWVQNNDALGDGATKTFFYNINTNSMPLRIMMTYYDAAGNALQKDADLRVTIGANVYWGNNMSAGWSTSSTSTRDHTNPTEGFFLDAAHGLPASGTVQVDVVGFNDPGGMNYSLAVSGDVASTTSTQVSLDKGKYTCSDTIKVTVNDASATSPVSVTLTSKNSSSSVIDTQLVSCTGSNGVFIGTILAGSGIIVSNGGSVTATYGAVAPATATVSCQLALSDGGATIAGGCDDNLAGTDQISGPLTNGGVNEFYTHYMDAGENSSYSFGFNNLTGGALHDVTVNVSFSGAGASKMSVFNNPIHIGNVPTGALAGAVFQLSTDLSTAGLTSVNLDFDITSPADGYTTPKRITQVQLLQANDVISRQKQCSTFNAGITGWFDTAVGGRALSGWKWSGSATTPATISSENRTDGICSNSTANAAAMIGNSLTTSGNNFTGNSDSFLMQRFQPILQGNGPSGQPYHYAWKWHSFYHASETLGATTGVWGAFYNDQWNQAVNPTGDQGTTFPISLAYFYQTVFDYVGTWNWEVANTGTPDDPRLNTTSTPIAAPNQLFVTFTNVTGLATSSTWFAYGHEHADITVFGGTSSATTRRDIALDNDNLVYDEFYATAQAGVCNGGSQVGTVAFDLYSYNSCPSGTATLSVIDANASGPITVTVTSPGTGDSEVVTLTGAGPYYSGTIPISTQSGRGNNNGTLFVLPSETITATYTDTAPAGTSTASALIGCTGGAVTYVSSAQVSDNGDNDGVADNNETVTMDITIQNNLATTLTNAKVTIFSDSPNIDCIPDNQALYGSIVSGASATNPPSDRFTFHVSPNVACADWQNPPTGKFTVVITGDGIDGSSTLQSFTINLDLDANLGGGSYTYTQNFNSDPGWAFSVTAPDNAGCTSNTYTNNFHWCAACGNAGAGLGAWIGNSAFGTSGQNYTAAYNSSTVTSPAFVANGATTLAFQVAYRTETTFDGAIVQYRLNAGTWTNLGFTTPAQAATTASNFCSPILASTAAWTGNGVSWTSTNAASVPSTSGQTVQFRWRLGGDVSGNGTTYGGYGVDNVSITNLKQTLICEPTRNSVVAGNSGTVCEGGTVNLSATFLPGASYSWTGPNGFTSSQQNPQITNAPASATGTYTVTVTVNGCSVFAGSATTNVNVIGNGQSCSDGSACTTGDVCNGGTCTGTPLNCDDNNFCTSDSCNPATGCVYVNNTNPCNDNNACTTGDVCGGGTCNGTPITCNDSNPCTDDSCNPATGCVYTNNTAPCSDGNACTTGDVCSGGSCQPGGPTNCDDNNPCTDDSCNPLTGCVHTNNTASCDDGNACTSGDVCGGGTCHGTPIVCNDSNPCTDDSCNPASGCVYTNNTASCNDGNACTSNDTCSGGTCGGTPVVCNDSNPCTDDSCNPATGCVYTNNTASCNDGNACTTGDTCGGGTCNGTPVVCNDSNPCTDDSCNPATGCVYTPNTAPCDDGNACTAGDVCGGGTCHAGAAVICNDNNPCTDDSCNPATGCVYTNNTAPCDDGNACTTGDTCGGGSCQPGGPTSCDDGNPCTDDSCDPVLGCVHTNNTASCDDGNACTSGDTCSDGVCQPGAAVTCNDNNPCTDDSCDPQTGCVYTNNTASCDDGNACTTGDVCSDGTCSGAAVNCDDNNPCTDDSCNPATGCVHTDNTAPCSDGNACTTGDTCGGGTCHAGAAVICNDNNPCTDDSCNPATGCVYTPNTAPCNDGNACTSGDVCGGGTCHAGAPVVCNDNNPCTDDSCNPATGCVYTPNTAPCNDGNACTTGDTCGGGTCHAGAPVVCNDSNPCTDDSCNPATGCVYTNNTASCDDGNACTTGDTCGGGTCHAGGAVTCDDNNPCTDDSCNPATGCVYTNNTASCDDGNACTSGDTCGGGTCHGGAPVVCNDNNACTTDSCNPATGCVYTNNNNACDDGNACTSGDVCGGGSCHGTPIVCNDNNVCTDDSCNPATGCVYTANTASCDDGNDCTTGDTCSGGTCSGTPVAAPGEVTGVLVDKSGSDAVISWTVALGATQSDMVRGSLGALPVGPGGGDETCFNDLSGATATDASVPAADSGYFYLVRGQSACGTGTWGDQVIDGVSTARTSTTCP
ncbi:MAG TPA: hypothetical protein VFV19_10635 [Candidatus Polarisedimenticolaceae bacterium]|nr:hypothetical protein [Candidatus Polarisedimenticolaceae bacterium]